MASSSSSIHSAQPWLPSVTRTVALCLSLLLHAIATRSAIVDYGTETDLGFKVYPQLFKSEKVLYTPDDCRSKYPVYELVCAGLCLPFPANWEYNKWITLGYNPLGDHGKQFKSRPRRPAQFQSIEFVCDEPWKNRYFSVEVVTSCECVQAKLEGHHLFEKEISLYSNES